MFAVLAAAGRKLHAKACRQEAEACQCKAQHPGTVHAGLRESGCMAVGGCSLLGYLRQAFCRLSGDFRRLRRFFRGHRRFRHRGGGRLVRRFRDLQLLLQHLVQLGFIGLAVIRQAGQLCKIFRLCRGGQILLIAQVSL